VFALNGIKHVATIPPRTEAAYRSALDVRVDSLKQTLRLIGESGSKSEMIYDFAPQAAGNPQLNLSYARPTDDHGKIWEGTP
jgi:hypothetical protein